MASRYFIAIAPPSPCIVIRSVLSAAGVEAPTRRSALRRGDRHEHRGVVRAADRIARPHVRRPRAARAARRPRGRQQQEQGENADRLTKSPRVSGRALVRDGRGGLLPLTAELWEAGPAVDSSGTGLGRKVDRRLLLRGALGAGAVAAVAPAGASGCSRPPRRPQPLTVGGLAVTCNLTLPVACAANDAANPFGTQRRGAARVRISANTAAGRS